MPISAQIDATPAATAVALGSLTYAYKRKQNDHPLDGHFSLKHTHCRVGTVYLLLMWADHGIMYCYLGCLLNISLGEEGMWFTFLRITRAHGAFSFVDVAEPSVQKVLDNLNSKVYRGRTLAVNFAKKNTEAAPKA